MNHTIFSITTVLFTSVILVILYIGLFSWFYCSPTKKRTKKTPLDYKLPAELIEFYSHGKRLEGWFIGKKLYSETDRLVILTHGWSTNFLLLLPFAKFLYKSGFDLFLYDCRGHGNSAKDGPITLKKMAQDISAAIDYAYQNIKSANLHITIIGHSFGASAGILAASYDDRIEKVVACSPFSDPKTLTSRHIKQNKIPMGILIHLVFYFIERWLGTTINNIAPINRIKHINKDVLLIHGTKDQIIPYSDSVSLNTACPSNKVSFLKIENRGHFDILRDPIFRDKVVEFVKPQK